MDSDEFRRLGHEMIDWIATYRETLADRPVMARTSPGEIRARLPVSPPSSGGAARTYIEHLDRDVLDGITHWNHPAFFAYFPSNASYASILGDLACSGLGVQGMSWQTSPAATEVEQVVMDWLRQMIDLPSTFTGVIQDTASTATLGALICARERTTGFAGVQDGGAPLVVYASSHAHSSIDKAVSLSGLGVKYLRAIPVDERYAMRVSDLRAAIASDRAAGLRPCAIVATSGTTNTTAFDPIDAIAEVAAAESMWLHVDAAMAGTGMIVPECRALWRGIERADSLVFNPHKWMGVGFDLSAYYCRDPQHLIRVMGTNPTYLRTSQDGEVANFRDWHVQLGRRFRALKLWFYLLDVGVDGIRARLRRDLANAAWLGDQVVTSADWELVAPVALQTVCIAHRGGRTNEIAAAINASGRAYVTPSTLDGKPILRVSIGAERTERVHVEALWHALVEA